MTVQRIRRKPASRGVAAPEPPAEPSRYVLRLYVTGTTARSMRAIENITRICQEHLAGRYEIEVIDLYQQASLAAGEQIVAAPTLIRKLPLPLRRLVGDMSDENSVLFGLDLRSPGQVTK